MKKINTTINRPDISVNEINKGKDFDQLYKSYTKATKPFFKQKWFIANTIVVIGAIALIFVLNTPEEIQKETTTEMSTKEVVQITENNIAAPFVTPPIEGVNVPFSSYEVSGSKKQTITHSSGTIIKIPKNAFVTEAGNLVKGKVEIKYREFKNVAEIIASGIPMTYEQNGEEMHFESAGMIEILAYQDGKPVFMNPEKKIDIEMTSDYPGDHYNLYSLDTTNRKWVDEGKDKVIIDNTATPVETTSSDKEVIHEWLAENEINQPEQKLAELKKEIKVIENDIQKIKKKIPKKPQKASEERFRFDIDFKKEEFPELTVYKSMEFEVGEENTHFTPKLFKKEWQDMVLTKHKQENGYIITLMRFFNKKGTKRTDEAEYDKEEVKLSVYPVFAGENYTKAMEAFTKKFETYSKQLNERKQDEKEKREAYERQLAEIKAENERIKKERALQAKNAIKINKTTQQIYRVFSIYQFGTHNCDTPIKWPKGQSVLATFTNNGEQLLIARLYMVEKGRNAVFPIMGTKRIKFNPNVKNYLVGITVDNKLVTYSTDQFKAIDKSVKTHDFKMEVKKEEVENVNDLKKCISFL